MNEMSTDITSALRPYEVCLVLNTPDFDEPPVSREQCFEKLNVLSAAARNEFEWWLASTGIDARIMWPDKLVTPLLFVSCPQALIDLLSSDETRPQIVKEFAVQDANER